MAVCGAFFVRVQLYKYNSCREEVVKLFSFQAILDCCENAVNLADSKGRTVLHYACAEGSADCVRTLLAYHRYGGVYHNMSVYMTLCLHTIVIPYTHTHTAVTYTAPISKAPHPYTGQLQPTILG